MRRLRTRNGIEYLVVCAPVPSAPVALTAAEREVARLACEGRSLREIARGRGRAERTIANQLASIYRKLGVSTRQELAARLNASDLD